MKWGAPPAENHAETKKRFSLFLGGIFLFLTPFVTPQAFGLDLDIPAAFDFYRDPLTLSFYREERPSFYWVNIGVPDKFFEGVNQQVFGPVPPNPLVYSVRSVEYGLRVNYWCLDQFQLKMNLPFEANALLDANGNTQNASKFGDLEIGFSYLLAGKGSEGSFFGVDGFYRFATGTNPFTMTFPLLSTGKGAPGEAIGLIAGQELGGFSFFQSVHYEKTQPINLDSSNLMFGSGVFQWPDSLQALGRINYQVFRRAQRRVDLFYEMRLRMTDLMEFNQQSVLYGQNYTTDRLFFSTAGLSVRADKEFTATGKITFFPFDFFGVDKLRPDSGWLFSLTLQFRPI
jgi:hypothetical protein